MGSFDKLVCFHCTVARSESMEIEAEEEEIVALSWVVVDLTSNQAGSVLRKVVKSSSSDSSQAVEENSVVNQAEQFGKALEQFDEFLQKELNDKETKWCLVTDGQLPLRHYIHPEALKKKLKLSNYFCSFFDLRKEFKRYAKNAKDFSSLQDIANYCKIDANNNDAAGLENGRVIASIAQYLNKEGHKFRDPEKVSTKYEPGPCLGMVLDDTVLRARGLPWQASDQDVANFFKGLSILRGGIAFCLNSQGRRNGEAFIRFEKPEHRDLALIRHKHHLGTRYIEVYKATAQDFIRIVRGPLDVTQIAANFVSSKAEVIIRMRGLPFSTKASDVKTFFGDDAPVYKGEAGILIVRSRNGKATGDAFVLFETEENGCAALKKHREVLGSRYVELFRSSQSEVQQVLSSYTNYGQGCPPLPIIPTHLAHQPQFRPPLFVPGGKDCLRLRGLPFSATVQDVLDFLKEHAAYVVPAGVHMVYNTQGRPSGDAYVQLLSSDYAQDAASGLHKQHMGERYIEVFQCSANDIATILTTSAFNHATKMQHFNNYNFNNNYTHYPVPNGVMGHGVNTSPVNGHSHGHGHAHSHSHGHGSDTVMTPTQSPSHSPTGMYLQQPPYYNCVLPTSGVGCNSVNYYTPLTSSVRLRMSPYLTQPLEMMPFFQGYQVADYGAGPIR